MGIEEESSIDKLNRVLESREGIRGVRDSSYFHESKNRRVASDWAHNHSKKPRAKKVGKLPKLFFALSVVFFLIALGIAGFVITKNSNVVSADNIDITLMGPSKIGGGEKLSLDISVSNRNSATLKTADLIIKFPVGSRDPDDPEKELTQIRESLGDVSSGSRVKKTISARVFGRVGDEHEANVSLEYRLADSNAIFVKEKVFSYEINNSPVEIIFDAPSEISAEQEFELTVTLRPNTEEKLERLSLVAEYPFGFEYLRATKEPTVADNVWEFGEFLPGGRESIKVIGKIKAQDNEERTFHFGAGILDNNKTELETEFSESSWTIAVKRPFIDVFVSILGSLSDIVNAKSGEAVKTNISWRNNLSVPVEDVVIEASITGDALDKSSINVEKGFYRSSDNKIILAKDTNPSLAFLAPGDEGSSSFVFKSFNFSETDSFRSPTIDLTFNVKGKRQDTGEAIGTKLGSRTVRISSDVSFASRVVYFDGPFENFGEVPPKADEKTSYTVIWSVSNSSNDIKNVRVSATIPSYVDWLGNVSPDNGEISFSSSRREITWDAGIVEAGTGYRNPPKEIAFQIAFLPSISQVGISPIVMSESAFSAVDNFTNVSITKTAQELTTRFNTDSSYKTGMEKVVR